MQARQARGDPVNGDKMPTFIDTTGHRSTSTQTCPYCHTSEQACDHCATDWAFTVVDPDSRAGALLADLDAATQEIE